MATTVFGMDTPMERPGAGQRAGVFVPSADASEAVKAAMKNGSGMCGFGNLDGTVMIYFENNKFNDSALHKWENKIYKAYDRMVNHAPTVNKLNCDAASLVQVGFVKGREILVTDMDALMGWLNRCDAADTAPESAEIHD
ncbi:MAG TPA: hypothetical protein VGD30_09905 [Telluria sp.]